MTSTPTRLDYEVEASRTTGRRTGAYTRVRRTDFSWRAGQTHRKSPGVWTSTLSSDAGAVPDRTLDLRSKHNEAWNYLDKSPWVPDHTVECFRVLTQRTKVLFSIYATGGLVRTELHGLHCRSAREAYDVIRNSRSLPRGLMNKSVREGAAVQYVIQFCFLALSSNARAEDEAYKALDSSCQSYVLFSRGAELS